MTTPCGVVHVDGDYARVCEVRPLQQRSAATAKAWRYLSARLFMRHAPLAARDHPPFRCDTAAVPDRSSSADVDRHRAGGRDHRAEAQSIVPGWFDEFLIDRATRKPSAHTLKAYRQDFAAIAAH